MAEVKEGIVDLKEYRDKKETPDELVEKLKVALAKAKEGKLRTVLLHFSYETEDPDRPLDENTIIYHKEQNLLEVIGLIELMKTMAIDLTFDDEDEDY